MRTESFPRREEKEKNIEKAALSVVLVLSGCMASPTVSTSEHPAIQVVKMVYEEAGKL